MPIGFSGYSDIKTANTGANIAPPQAPKNFQLIQAPEVTADGFASLLFNFTKPTKTVMILNESESDDIFSTTTVGTTDMVVYGANSVVIGTASDLTAVLSAGNIIQYGANTTKYKIQSITASAITMTYGLSSSVPIMTQIKKCVKTAESPSTSRQFRVTATVGETVDIYHTSGLITNKWTGPTTLGSFLDLDKVLMNITESNRVFAKETKMSSDAVPVVLTVGTKIQAAQKLVNFNGQIAGVLIPGDLLCFGSDEIFYEIASISTPTDVIMTVDFPKEYPAGTAMFKKKLMTDDMIPTPYVFTAYDSAPTPEFSGYADLTDLSGFKIYMKETTQSQGSKGSVVKTFTVDDENITKYNDGTWDFLFNATDDLLNGREMYFGLTAYDSEMPVYNESDGDLNAHLITLPTAVSIVSATVDQNAGTADVVYGSVTAGGKNPHLLAVMNNNVAEYSVRGGFDIYKRAFSALDMGKGYYIGIDTTTGKIIHPEILAGDFVEVRDTVSRHIWVASADVNGSAVLNDTNKTFGDAGISYMTGHKTINITTNRAAINRATDSVLPMTTDPIPVKQYLTEFANTFHISGLATNTEYCIAAESVDTEIIYEKL